jgi:hypothetical protein
MWIRVLPVTFLLGTSLMLAQSAPEPHQLPLRKAPPTEVVANDIAPAVTWEDPHEKLERAQIVNAVMERQIALRRDTEKLLFLAEELKQNVDKTGPNILSMEVIKKAQEIEKLAKSVKDKMKQAY